MNGKGVSKILNLNGTNGEKFRKVLLSEKIVSRRSKITVTHIGNMNEVKIVNIFLKKYSHNRGFYEIKKSVGQTIDTFG